MSLYTNFIGQQIVKPGAATRVISKLANSTVPGIGNLGVIGMGQAGAPGIQVFNNADAMRRYYRDDDLADAAGICFNASADTRIVGSAFQVFAYNLRANTQSTLNLTNGTVPLLTITSREYGAHTTKITVKYSSVTGQLSATFNDGINSFTETSPAFAAASVPAPKFTLQYAGTGSLPTVSITATGTSAVLTTSITGAAGDAVSIDLLNVTTLADLITLLNGWNGGGKYTATIGSGVNPFSAPANLDRVTATPITAAAPLTGIAQDVIDWCNNKSALLTAAREATLGITGVPASTTGTTGVSLAGGATGGTPNAAAWTTAFTALQQKRVNSCVPLIEKDTSGGATFLQVIAAATTYANNMNGSVGKNEVQVYMGFSGTEAATITNASTNLNTPHVTLTCHQMLLPDSQGVTAWLPAWSSALTLAALRCAAPLGEPLTYKYVRAYGIQTDSSFTLPDDTNTLLLAGVTLLENVVGKGFRVVKGNTTWTKTDDDAYTEESVVQVWKAFAYDLRSSLEDRFTGTKGTPANVSTIKDFVLAKGEGYRKLEAIVDTSDDAGNPLNACRDVIISLNKDVCNVSVTITPVEGINYTLATITLTGVRLTA
jgi:hypothetical protein